MLTRGQVRSGRPEGCVLSEEGSRGFWIWPHKLPRMSLWEAPRWLVPTTSSRGTGRGEVELSIVRGGGGVRSPVDAPWGCWKR